MVRDLCSHCRGPWGFLAGSVGKESACNAADTGDTRLIPGLGESPGGGNGNPLQYSCLKHPKDRGSWRDTVHWGADLITGWGTRTPYVVQKSQNFLKNYLKSNLFVIPVHQP